MRQRQLSFILLCLPCLALSVATKPCVLSFHAAGKQKQRAVFTALPLDESAAVFGTATGKKLICVCNGTTTHSPVHWLDRNGKELPKLKKAVYYRLDRKLKRKKSWTAVQLRIRNGFSCAEAGVYTCAIGESRRSVLVTPVGVVCPSVSPSPTASPSSSSSKTISTSISASAAVSSPSVSPSPSPPVIEERCKNDAEVCKGTNNAFQYRVITLPNALRVLLISNNKTSTAAAAMDVRSGTFQDTIPGLTNLFVNMLFLGTQKYPAEDAYSQFLTTNGGFQFRLTDSENTNYYFSVNSNKLEEALDRFAQFFIGPLLNEDTLNREINAINSQFELLRGASPRRTNLLLKDVADPRSKFSRFDIGNTATLTVPGIWQQVIEYYQKRYSANIMQLVIYGREDVEQLEVWAREIFSNISNKGIQPTQPPRQPFPAGYKARLIVYKPLTPTHELRIIWQTTSRQDLYRFGVMKFISELLNHAGKGSLSHYLEKTHSWASSIIFYQPDSTSGFALFFIDIDLTDAGVAHVEDVVTGVFGYIAMLKDSEDDELNAVWEVLKALDQIKFDYAPPPSGSVFEISDLAAKMRTVKDPADFLSPPQRSIWDITQVRSFLSYLTPDNSNILFAKPDLLYSNGTTPPSIHGDCTQPGTAQHNFNVSTADLYEPYYGTLYALYCTDPELIKKWEDPDIPKGTFFLPDFQRYAPHNLTLLPLPEDHSKTPHLVLDNLNGYRVWWMQDYQFRDPVVMVKCQAYTGAVAATVKDQALSQVFVDYVTELLNEVTDVASAASYQVNFDLLPSGLTLEFSGYSDPEVFMRFMKEVLSEVSDRSAASFRVNVETIRVAYQQVVNFLRDYQTTALPLHYAEELRRVMLLDPHYSRAEVLAELDNVTVDDLPTAFAHYMDDVIVSISRLECYVTGNVDRDGAIEYSGAIHEALLQNSTSEVSQEEDGVRVVKMKQGTRALVTRTLNPEVDGNSAIMVVKEVGPLCDVTTDPKDGSPVTCSEESLENTVYSNVLNRIMSVACSNTLRTQEQLGNAVFCGTYALENLVTTLFFLVQSSFRGPPYLLDRINNFTVSYLTSELTNALFEQGLEAYKVILKVEDRTLREQVNRLWIQIHNQHYKFNRREVLLNITERVTYAQFVDFYKAYVLGNLNKGGQTSVKELLIGTFSAKVANVTFDVPRQVEEQDQYESVREFKESAVYWDQ